MTGMADMQHSPTFTPDFPHSAADWLNHIADMLGAEASGMLIARPDGRHSLMVNGHSEAAISQYRDRFSRLDPLPKLLEERPDGRALVIDTTRHPAYLGCPELCNDYLRPHGIDHVIATQWRATDGSLHMVGVQRFRGSEPFSVTQGRELDRFIHHWKVDGATPQPEGLVPRSANSRRGCDIADQISIPLAVVDSRLVVAWANAAARTNPSAPWLALFNSLSKGNTASYQSDIRRCLQELIGTSLRQRSVGEALLPSNDETWFATVTPLVGRPQLALLRMTGTHHRAPGIRNRLENLYGLTRAEAEMTLLLAQGESLDGIATVRSVRVDTVRTQLRSVFKKTGMHRQGELVSLVGVLGGA